MRHQFFLSFLWLFFFSLFRWLGALIVYAVSWPLLFIWAILIYLFNTIWAMLAASLSTVFLVFASFFEVIAQFIPAAYFVFSLPLYILFSTFGFFSWDKLHCVCEEQLFDKIRVNRIHKIIICNNYRLEKIKYQVVID